MSAKLPITKEQNMKYAEALHLYFEGKKRSVKVSGDWIGDVFKLNIQDREFFTFRDALAYLSNVLAEMPAPIKFEVIELAVAV